jgi:glycosyltransferase involved in cell wall biosynthesis
MGSSTSQTHLEAFAPVLRDLCARDVVLRVVSDRKPELSGVRFEWRRWSAETEVAELADFDIGIMPMPDDRWARGKCAMKALLYMAVGVPVVCSAVGTNREVIRHGENGLLAASPEEWLNQLDSIIGDPAERERLGSAGRQTVEEGYSMSRCAAKFAAVVEEAVEGRRIAEGYKLSKTQAISE